MQSTTVTRQTTTVTSASGVTSASVVAVRMNTTFLSSIGGLLTLLEMILGIIIFALLHSYQGLTSLLYLYLVSFAYWLLSFFILFSGIISLTGTLLPTTLFFFVFHVFGFILYLAGGIAVLVEVSKYGIARTITSGALALIASICHFVHTAFVYRAH